MERSCESIHPPFVFRYYTAVEAKKERTSKHAQSFGTKKVSQTTTANQVCVLILKKAFTGHI